MQQDKLIANPLSYLMSLDFFYIPWRRFQGVQKEIRDQWSEIG